MLYEVITICSKCQKETAGPNFCGHCGTALWEKCPECGQMELIDRKFCNKEREKFWNVITSYSIHYTKLYDRSFKIFFTHEGIF